MSVGGYILEVEWAPGVEMPRWIGPFATAADAAEFERVNVPNGVGEIRELAYPYHRVES